MLLQTYPYPSLCCHYTPRDNPVAIQSLLSKRGHIYLIKKIAYLTIFSLAFAFVEAAVVFYIRSIFNLNSNYIPNSRYTEILNLGVIAFLAPGDSAFPISTITRVEAIRELATLVMLGSVALIAGKTFIQKLGAFLIAFSIWDIFYYVFLKFLTGWPPSVFTTDIFFINPVMWIGPVITALVSSGFFLIIGTIMFYRGNKKNEK